MCFRDLIADIESLLQFGEGAFFEDLGAEELITAVPGVGGVWEARLAGGE
jgi:hypothetical protein